MIHKSVKHGPIALGGDGFGWVRDEEKKLIQMPHKGNIDGTELEFKL